MIWRVGVAMAAASKSKMLKILAKAGNPNTVIFVCLFVLFCFSFCFVLLFFWLLLIVRRETTWRLTKLGVYLDLFV